MSAPTPSLTPRDYVDPHVYEREAELVLAANWLPLCRADQLDRPGARLAMTLVGHPVVAVRDGDTIRVLANVCAHRGSQIVEDGAESGSTIICPYHRWSYRLDGTLIGAPLTDGIDLDDVCLPVVRHAIWEGFVLVNLTGTAPDPSGALAGLSAELAPWRWSEMVTVASRHFQSTWNWKVMVENWIECYHHLGTHRESVEPYQPSRTTRVVPAAGGPWAAMTVQSLDGVEGPPEEWMPGVGAARATDLSVWGAFPLLLGGGGSRYGFWLQVLPIDVARHDVIWHLVAHPSQLDRFGSERTCELMDMLGGVHEEDMAACARVQ
ncbi:MAG TPA: aromatic ring-hydroxylating dioxygenase subunit alpha, partial [Ilumatobacteraceae bacterium]|nr:aromatic ring-hydroxylating dioxygenase subunit alpha [Ilumatobacteraceae bacterium]